MTECCKPQLPREHLLCPYRIWPTASSSLSLQTSKCKNKQTNKCGTNKQKGYKYLGQCAARVASSIVDFIWVIHFSSIEGIVLLAEDSAFSEKNAHLYLIIIVIIQQLQCHQYVSEIVKSFQYFSAVFYLYILSCVVPLLSRSSFYTIKLIPQLFGHILWPSLIHIPYTI